MHLLPQAKLDTHIVRHRLVHLPRRTQRAANIVPRRVCQATFQFIRSHAGFGRGRHEARIVRRVDGVVVDVDEAVAAACLDLVAFHGPAAVQVTTLLVADGGRVDGVVAVAFSPVLDAGKAVATRVADLLAVLDGHGGVV